MLVLGVGLKVLVAIAGSYAQVSTLDDLATKLIVGSIALFVFETICYALTK
jgi:hypothetical protein